MEFNKLIEFRKSIRIFDQDKKVSIDQIKEIIKAARMAPSWKNSQTARYYAIIDDKKIEEFRKTCLLSSNSENSKGAVPVVTTFKKDISGFNTKTGQAENNGGNGWGFYDLGLSDAYLILKAREIGLDTLIMGIRDEDKIREFLNIPDDEEIVSVIALGFRKEDPQARPRKDTKEILEII